MSFVKRLCVRKSLELKRGRPHQLARHGNSQVNHSDMESINVWSVEQITNAQSNLQGGGPDGMEKHIRHTRSALATTQQFLERSSISGHQTAMIMILSLDHLVFGPRTTLRMATRRCGSTSHRRNPSDRASTSCLRVRSGHVSEGIPAESLSGPAQLPTRLDHSAFALA
jgi:hypothetical protein